MKQGYTEFDWHRNYFHPANVNEGPQHQISLKCVTFTQSIQSTHRKQILDPNRSSQLIASQCKYQLDTDIL